MLRLSTQGFDGYGFDVDGMATIMGALLRAFPDITPQLLHLIGYSVYFIAILIIAWWWKRSSQITPEQIGLSLLIIMLASPHLHNHDYSLFLIPALILSLLWIRHNHIPADIMPIIPLSISLIIFIQIFIIPNSKFFIYLITLLMAWPLWKERIRISQPSFSKDTG